MAKEKKKSTTNVMKIVLDGLTAVLGGLVLAFLALPHALAFISGKAIEEGNLSGYDLLTFKESAKTGVAVVLLFVVILACLLIVGSIFKLLVDANVVKNSLCASIAKWLTICSAVLLTVMLVVNIITISTYCADNSAEYAGKVTGIVAGWVMLIINTVVGACSCVTAWLSSRK